MNWHPILSAAKAIATAVAIIGIALIVIFGQISKTRNRIAKYDRTGRFIDLLKIFSRW